jgi:hypothetical protein
MNRIEQVLWSDWHPVYLLILLIQSSWFCTSSVFCSLEYWRRGPLVLRGTECDWRQFLR